MANLILLIDDDPLIHNIVKSAAPEGNSFLSCFTIKEAHAMIDSGTAPDLIVVDRMLPDGDGLEICSRVRGIAHLSDTPVIFLSSKCSETDKVGGLFAGADDYITKPVSPLELKARIQARLRKSSGLLHLGNLRLDCDAQRAFHILKGVPTEIGLTRIEFKLLLVLIKGGDRISSRETLLNKVWGPSLSLSDRVVDTHVSNLRKKIAMTGVRIESLRGEGYRLSPEQAFGQAS